MGNSSLNLLKVNGTIYHQIRKLNHSFKRVKTKIKRNFHSILKSKF